MKTLGLVLAMLFLVGGCCLAATTTSVTISAIGTEWNMIALPVVPLDPAVGGNQAAHGIYPAQDTSGVFGAFNTESHFTLKSYDYVGGGYLTFGYQNPAGFGNLLLGTGYWVTGTNLTGSVTYNGLLDGVPDFQSDGVTPVLDSTGNLGTSLKTDMYVSLPGQGLGTGGWHLIGLPFNHAVALSMSAKAKDGSRFLLTDGTTVLDWHDAALSTAPGGKWINASAKGWDPVGGGYTTVGYGSSTNVWQPGNAYWVQTLKDNLAMIIPGNEYGVGP